MVTKKVEEFIDKHWYKNYRFGLEVRIGPDRAMDDEMLQQRIAWLELPERERIKILEKTVVDCQHLSLDVVEELESQARQVPSLIDKVKSLQLELGLLKIDKAYRNTTDGVSIKFGNGTPPLTLNIYGDQFKMLYQALAKAFHPDKHPKDKQQYDAIMKDINLWNDEVLGKNVKRKSI